MKLWKMIVMLGVFVALAAFLCVGCAPAAQADEQDDVDPQMQMEVNDKPDPNAKAAAAGDDADFTVSMDPFYILVMGLDTREGTVEKGSSQSYSDTMMLVRVDPNTCQVGLLSVPRDTYAWVHDQDEKINSGYFYDGPQGAIDQVELLTGVRADYYMTTTFVGFEKIIDGIGGVDAYVPIDMELKDIVNGGKIYLYAGEQHLDGPSALVLSRVRKAYSWDGDTHRQTNSRYMIENIIRNVAANPDQAAQWADTLYNNVETDLDRRAFDAYVNAFCQNPDAISFVDGTTPYDNGMDDAIGLWIVYRDEETSRACADAVTNFQDPQAIVPLPYTY